jgi:hypothetical protein
MSPSRLYFTGEQVSQALLDAGFVLSPEDSMGTKFDSVARALGGIARKIVKEQMEKFLSEFICGDGDWKKK